MICFVVDSKLAKNKSFTACVCSGRTIRETSEYALVDRWDSVARCRHTIYHGLSFETAGHESSTLWSESSNGKSMEEDSASPKNRQWGNMCAVLLCFAVQGCENCVYSFGALHPACGVKGFWMLLVENCLDMASDVKELLV